MSRNIPPVTGMKDVLSADIGLWQHVERAARTTMDAYGYEEIRVPVVEHTELFKRAIGEFTDVVEKEMYTFTDQGGDSLTLRPEATAGIVRATISNGLLRGARLKLWCQGPMFRHEKPQKGRFRQFNQIDLEAIGFAGPDVDVEIIALTARLWKLLGLTRVKLQINSLGTPESRKAYRSLLQDYFRAHLDKLDDDGKRRLEGNPLRILDSKHAPTQEIVKDAPVLTDHLDPESQAHFAELRAGLDALGIPYTVNPRLVRGLDYYSRTVFEWITDALGSQDAVCSGGRYDGLIAQMGGEATPAIGFAMGVERVVELVRLAGVTPPANLPDVFVMAQGDAAQRSALALAEKLRDQLPGSGIVVHCGSAKFKTQFRRADESGARVALVIGDDELARGVVAFKPLLAAKGGAESTQTEYPVAEVGARVAEFLRRST
ncbi:MAG TPA: histidine--tRNA ligase [Steroidobacteraceae bacterium]|nr:histidine--tRNA ligase [Steroidobacteraceae bacterium]